MKIALCFAGQPRYFSENFAYWDFALSGLDVDIFVHSWYDKNEIGEQLKNPHTKSAWVVEPNSDKKIMEMYKPKRSLFEKQRIFTSKFDDIGKNYLTEDGSRIWLGSPKILLSSMFSIKSSVKLMQDYIEQNPSTKYDQVIVTRFDFVYVEKLKHVLKPNNNNFMTAYVPGVEWNKSQMNDVFLVSNYDNMLEYSRHFDFWEQDLNRGIPLCPHRLKFAYLQGKGHTFEQVFKFPTYEARKWFLNRGQGLHAHFKERA